MKLALSPTGYSALGAGLGAAVGATRAPEGHKLRGAALGGLGGGVLGHAAGKFDVMPPLWEGVKGLGRLLNPRTMGSELKGGWEALSNRSPRQVEDLEHVLTRKPNANPGAALPPVLGGAGLGAGVGYLSGSDPEEAKHRALVGAGLGAAGGALVSGEVGSGLRHLARGGNKSLSEIGYTNDIGTATGPLAKLREGGWLSNNAKYTGDSLPRKALNTASRALPGQKGLAVGLPLAMLPTDAAETDPTTGERRGVGERALGIGLSAAGGVAAFRHGGILPGAVVGIGSGMVGRRAGRGIDALMGHDRTPREVIPAPVEQG